MNRHRNRFWFQGGGQAGLTPLKHPVHIYILEVVGRVFAVVCVCVSDGCVCCVCVCFVFVFVLWFVFAVAVVSNIYNLPTT